MIPFKCAPLKTRIFRKPSTPWVTPELRARLKDYDKTYKKATQTATLKRTQN